MSAPTTGSASHPRVVLTVLAWAWVVVPFLYGLYQLLIKIPVCSAADPRRME